MKAKITFYSRYVTGLSPEAALNQRFPLRGRSPFGDGEIEIDEKGNFTCSASRAKGAPVAFLQKLYPLLTEQGAQKIIEVESQDQPELESTLVKRRLADFQSDAKLMANLSEQCGASQEMVRNIPIWVDHDGHGLNTVQFSNTRTPICLINWQLGERNEIRTGIPRIIPVPKAKRVWFVENSLEAHILHQIFKEPFYVRPDQECLNWNEYRKLTKDKQVVLLRHSERGDYKYSFFPLLRKLSQWNHACRSVSIEPLTRGEPFLSWIMTGSNQKELLKFAESEKPSLPDLFDEDTYHQYIGRAGITSLYSPQDAKSGMYWYKINDGSFVHSYPMNICTQSELVEMHNLESDGEPNHQIRLKKDTILNIQVSLEQLGPYPTFTRLKQLIIDYIHLEHKEMATLIALWIMGGYVYRLFPAYAYLHLIGDKGSGKTTLLELIAMTGFNGLLESQSTRASVINLVDKLGCTLCLDEFESSALGTGDDYTQMLKGGYKKGGNYSKKDGKASVRLNTYSPKVLASIDSIGDQALKSRTIPVNTITVPSSVSLRVWDVDGKLEQQRAEVIRQGCYALGLFHHQSIQRLYNHVPIAIKLPNGGNLNSRKRQVVAPLVAIAQLVDVNREPETETELLKAIEIAWEAEQAGQATNEKLLSDILSKWNGEPDFKQYRIRYHITWIDNRCWNETSLSNHLGGQINMLNWLSRLPGVEKQAIHINKEFGTKSCTGFPDNLKINGKRFRDWFSR